MVAVRVPSCNTDQGVSSIGEGTGVKDPNPRSEGDTYSVPLIPAKLLQLRLQWYMPGPEVT